MTKKKKPKTKRTSVTIRQEYLDWIDDQIEKLRFRSRSHAIEKALDDLRKKIVKEDKDRQ